VSDGPAIGVDVGGTKVLAVAIVGESVVAEHSVVVPRESPELLATIAASIEELEGRLDRAVVPVGVGLPGLVDRRGVLWASPHLPRIVPLEAAAALRAGLGDRPIVVDNDANLATRAEVAWGALGGVDTGLLVAVGTGIGGGLVVGGRLAPGAHGFAGEVGHMVVDAAGPPCACGRRGCFETVVSGSALARRAQEELAAGAGSLALSLAGGDPGAVRAEEVVEAARRGDALGRQLIDELAHWAAIGLLNLTNVFDPERIVLAGGLVSAGEVVVGPVRRAFAGLLPAAWHRAEVPLEVARLGSRAGAIGAALAAREVERGGSGGGGSPATLTPS
jgi:glucokinase